MMLGGLGDDDGVADVLLVDSNRIVNEFMGGLRGANVHRQSFPAPHQHQHQYQHDRLSRPDQWGPGPGPGRRGSHTTRDSSVRNRSGSLHSKSVHATVQSATRGRSGSAVAGAGAGVRPMHGLRPSEVAQEGRNSGIGSGVVMHSDGQQLHLQHDDERGRGLQGGGEGGGRGWGEEYSDQVSLSAPSNLQLFSLRESVGGGHSRGSELEMPVRFSDVEADQPSTLKSPLHTGKLANLLADLSPVYPSAWLSCPSDCVAVYLCGGA